MTQAAPPVVGELGRGRWWRRAIASALAGALLGVGTPARADDEPGLCRVVEVAFVPAADLQIVAWLEDAAGNYVDTIYITHAVGTFGLGNRPGMLEFNSGPAWPYGRREQVFPVWAHRHGHVFPRVDFQNGDDRNLSHPFTQSSVEHHYCRPIAPEEPMWDAGTCASAVYTDKGVLSELDTSVYPPRVDVFPEGERDHPSVAMFRSLNPFDAVSQATPAGDVPVALSWAIPSDLPPGDYRLLVEVSKEFDMNETYNEVSYPEPVDISWASFGAPYRGQPSVVYQVPFELGEVAVTASTDAYAGYGDPDGQDGELRVPDATITVDVPGSGAARLALTASAGGTYRLAVTARPEVDEIAPGHIDDLSVAAVDHATATVTFSAPGEDGAEGRVAGYDIRYRADGPVTDENFESSTPISDGVVPELPGELQSFELAGLLPETTYHVGVRAYDACRNQGALAQLVVETTARITGEVDACFVATAAYGSPMAGDVELLRQFRDGFLEQTVLGQLAVEAYYTFGPAAAGVIAESELLRETARAALAPVVARVRDLAYPE
ncbi:MAG: fibronectin type III domain-containing protein [Kofleriaceae bacterium]